MNSPRRWWIARELLPENAKLQHKIDEMKSRIDLLQVVDQNAMETINHEQLLQILNYAGLSGLEKLKRIGPAKAKKILNERDNGLFSSVLIYWVLCCQLDE